MNLKEMTIQGFRALSEPFSFKWSGTAGLYYLTGRNEENESLGANGVGKSSLFDAVCWVLFGETARGLKGPDLKSWYGNKPLKGSIIYTMGNTTHSITRSWSPNSLCFDGTEVEQEEVIKRLGFDKEAFLRMCYFAQFEDSFLSLTPSSRMQLFSEVLGLEQWDIASRNALDAVAVAGKEVAELQNELNSLDQRIAELNPEDLESKSEWWEKERDGRRDKAIEECAKMGDQLRALRKSIPRTGSDNTSNKIQSLEQQLEKARDELAVVRTQIGERSARLDGLKLQKGQCTLCGQKLTKEHIAQERRLLQSQLDRMEECRTLWKKAESDTQEALTQARKAKRLLDDEAATIKSEVNTLERLLAAGTKAVTQIEKEANPYTEAIAQSHKRIKELKGKRAQCEEELSTCHKLHEGSKFWVQGFKDLRLTLIDRALEQLNLEVAQALEDLGLGEWGLRFEVETETKSGTVKRGFQALVTPPKHDKPVKWEVSSGGEGQRLTLAVNFGLSNLLCSRSGVKFGVEFFDEPTKHMNEEGINDLLGVLYDRAKSGNKQVWLADHHSMHFGGFEGQVCLVKKKDGSINVARVR